MMGNNQSKYSMNPQRVLARSTSKGRVPRRQLSDTPYPQAASVSDRTMEQRVDSETLDPQAPSSSDMKVNPCDKYLTFTSSVPCDFVYI